MKHLFLEKIVSDLGKCLAGFIITAVELEGILMPVFNSGDYDREYNLLS